MGKWKDRAKRAEAALLGLYDACWVDNGDDLALSLRAERGDVDFMHAFVAAWIETAVSDIGELRAQVQRVRELADTIDSEIDAFAPHWWRATGSGIKPNARVTSRIRAALEAEID